jgi:hypothetical protein
MGKGSGRRPAAVSQAEYERNYERLFPPKRTIRGEYDELAARFYQATGLFAPGKSVPLELADDVSDEERRQRWREWVKTQ